MKILGLTLYILSSCAIYLVPYRSDAKAGDETDYSDDLSAAVKGFYVASKGFHDGTRSALDVRNSLMRLRRAGLRLPRSIETMSPKEQALRVALDCTHARVVTLTPAPAGSVFKEPTATSSAIIPLSDTAALGEAVAAACASAPPGSRIGIDRFGLQTIQ